MVTSSRMSKVLRFPIPEDLKGIDVAAILGIVGGNADKALEVLSEEITPEDIARTKELIATEYLFLFSG